MKEHEMREWALSRYDSTAIADDLELVQLLYDDVATVERSGGFPADDDLPFDAFMAELHDRLRRVYGRDAR